MHNDDTIHVPHNHGTTPTPDLRHHGAKRAGDHINLDATESAESRTKGPASSESARGAADLPGQAAAHESALCTLLKNNFAASYSTDNSEEFIKWLSARQWVHRHGGERVWLTAHAFEGEAWPAVSPHVDAFEACARVVEDGDVLLDPLLPAGSEQTQMVAWLPEGWSAAGEVSAPTSGDTVGGEAVTVDPNAPGSMAVFDYYEAHKAEREQVLGYDVTGTAVTLEQMEQLHAAYPTREAPAPVTPYPHKGLAEGITDWDGEAGRWAGWLWVKPTDGSVGPVYLITDGDTLMVAHEQQIDAIEELDDAVIADRVKYPLNPADAEDVACAEAFNYVPDHVFTKDLSEDGESVPAPEGHREPGEFAPPPAPETPVDTPVSTDGDETVASANDPE